MSRRIITISREFGSGGRAIGEAVAKQLGFTFYDKDLIAEVAEKSGLSKEFIEKKGEYSPLKNIFSYAFVGRDSSGNSLDDYLYSIQRDIILDLAEKEPCVIVGRCADFILKNRTDCINVFIHGEEHEKLLRIQSLYQKSESEAKKLMHETSGDRKNSGLRLFLTSIINFSNIHNRQFLIVKCMLQTGNQCMCCIKTCQTMNTCLNRITSD